VTGNDHTLFHFSLEHAVYPLFGTDAVFQTWHSYVGSPGQLCYPCLFLLV